MGSNLNTLQSRIASSITDFSNLPIVNQDAGYNSQFKRQQGKKRGFCPPNSGNSYTKAPVHHYGHSSGAPVHYYGNPNQQGSFRPRGAFNEAHHYGNQGRNHYVHPANYSGASNNPINHNRHQPLADSDWDPYEDERIITQHPLNTPTQGWAAPN